MTEPSANQQPGNGGAPDQQASINHKGQKVPGTPAKYKIKNTKSTSWTRFLKLREDNKYTDVILKAGNREFPCHRVVLAAASEYFDAMFSSELKERTAKEIEMKGTDAKTLSFILDFIYSVELEIPADKIQDVLKDAHLFQLTDLTTSCEDILSLQLCPANCLGFYKLARLYSLENLGKAVRSIMIEKLREVIRSNEFKELTAEELEEYIGDSNIPDNVEDIIFVAVRSWVEYNSLERAPIFPKLAQHIRFPLCSKEFLCDEVALCPLMLNVECQKHLIEAVRIHMLPESSKELCATRKKSQNFITGNESLLLVSSQSRWLTFEPGNTTWMFLTDLPQCLYSCWFDVIALPDGIMVMADGCHLFNFQMKKWETLPKMSEYRYEHGTVLHKEHVYVIGGSVGSGNRKQRVSSVLVYCVKNKCWFNETNLPGRYYSSPLAVSFSDYIYVFVASETLGYNTEEKRWYHFASSPGSLVNGSAALVNHTIYIASPQVFQSYNVKDDVWKELTFPWPEVTIRCHSLTALNGKLLFCPRGYTKDDPLTVCSVSMEYDPEKDAWFDTQVPKPPNVGRDIRLLTIDNQTTGAAGTIQECKLHAILEEIEVTGWPGYE